MGDEQNTAAQIPDALSITLRTPVEFGGETYARLDLKEPSVAQWAQWDKLEGLEAEVKAVAAVSGLPEAAVRQIGARDFVQAARYLSRFLA